MQEIAKQLSGRHVVVIMLTVADDRRVVVVAEGGEVQVLRCVLVDFEVHADPHRVHLQLVPADEFELALAQQQDLLRPPIDPVAPLPWSERAQGLLKLALGSWRHVRRLKYGRGHLEHARLLLGVALLLQVVQRRHDLLGREVHVDSVSRWRFAHAHNILVGQGSGAAELRKLLRAMCPQVCNLPRHFGHPRLLPLMTAFQLCILTFQLIDGLLEKAALRVEELSNGGWVVAALTDNHLCFIVVETEGCEVLHL